jgi:hypothetical protein
MYSYGWVYVIELSLGLVIIACCLFRRGRMLSMQELKVNVGSVYFFLGALSSRGEFHCLGDCR